MGWWQHYIEHVGLTIHSDISHFVKIMDITARNKFPIHARRMKCFTHIQKGDTMSHLREIVESIKLADWSTFNEEAAAMHIFMATTRDEEAKRACYKLLGELPEGDVGMLMTKITAIEAFPEHRTTTSVKPIITNPEVPRKICTNCKLKGHLAPEGWGKWAHCACFGHKSQLCRSRPQPEPVKKTDGKKSKGKNLYLLKKNKEKAKRIPLL